MAENRIPLGRVPDEYQDEALTEVTPRFTKDQLFYLQQTFAKAAPSVFTPSSVDSTVKLLGVIGERKGVQSVLAHIQSIIEGKAT